MKTVTVTITAWDNRKVTMREPTIRDVLETQNVTSVVQRSIEMLGRMILDANGKSIGAEAVLDMPSRAFAELQIAMNAQLDQGSEDEPVPLSRANGSGTASPSP